MGVHGFPVTCSMNGPVKMAEKAYQWLPWCWTCLLLKVGGL